MTHPTLSPLAWLNLSTTERHEIARLFNIPQTKPSHVVGSQVVDSGHSWDDLAKITVSSMQELLDSNLTEFSDLWVLLLQRVRGIHPVQAPVEDEPLGVVKAKKTKNVR